MEDLAGIACGTTFEGIVKGADDDGSPEVADGAIGLSGTTQPFGEWFRVGWRISTQEAEQSTGDAELVAEGKHVSSEKAERGVHGCGEKAGTDVTAASRASGSCRLEEWNGVIPANVVVRAAAFEKVNEVSAAVYKNML